MPHADLPPAVLIAIGALLLAFGRRLYWLLVGLAGFVLGFVLAERFIELDPQWLNLLFALLLAALFSMAAVFFQKVAVALIGFLLGGALLLLLADAVHWSPGNWVWLAALAAAVVGALLTRWLFEIALVVLSSLLGASFIVRAVGWADPVSSVLLLGLTAAGVLFQLLVTGRKKKNRS